MFCNKCGTKLPDGTTFCTECGANLAPIKKSEPTPKAEPAPEKSAAKAIPEVKIPEVKLPDLKKLDKPVLVLVTMALSILLIIMGISSTMNMPFYEIPAASFLLDMSGDEDAAEELLDSVDESIDDMEDELNFKEDFMDDDEVEAVEDVIKSMKTLKNEFSINNFNKFVELLEDIDEDFNSGFDVDEIDEIQAIMGTLVAIIRGSFVLPVLFWVLGGLRKSAGLTITAMVFTTISQLIYCGLLWVIISLAVGVAQVKLCKAINPKKKKQAVAAAE